MFHQPFELADTRILVTNDDGIGAPGLKVLTKIALSFSQDVWVVAPEQEQSGAGHSLTLRRPLSIRKLGARRYAVDGTPTDCVLLAVNKIMRGKRPALVLSGINRGGNMGEDVTYSGTVAAAMEGTLLDIPSVAMSLHIGAGSKPKWTSATHYAPEVIRRLAAAPWPRGALMNVNFPDFDTDAVTGIEVTTQGKRKLGDNLVETVDPRGRLFYWIGPSRDEDATRAGTDINAVYRGAVAVTPINVDFTDRPALADLRRVFT